MKQHNFKLDRETMDILEMLTLLDEKHNKSNVVREAIRQLAKSKGKC